MFQDLDATIGAMLQDPAAPQQLRGAQIAFDTPDRNFQPAHATLNLFLHELSENRELRDDARVMELSGTTYTSRLPSIRIDCVYLLTAWSTQSAALKTAEEHQLLGAALVWLARFPTLETRFLRGVLQNQPYPVPATVAQTREGQQMGHFWSALGIAPRPAFSLTVTVAADPFDQTEQFRTHTGVIVKTVLEHP
ncbi:hypothetical protein Acor_55450 [Acrocarpospora corrugata]|uniref:Pvc16 N-terminal domain-containing protein n=1 Tax=Acrocarpospora corrugata TaxID=35763 RepID=A0A5M3W5A2_9ACTN|nr:DUF4255 domain-containing protein [Acrocarpospora corrugata]GES03479.1 hypothetical protein Acor_55450 [Acrocarpospora corrugata]